MRLGHCNKVTGVTYLVWYLRQLALLGASGGSGGGGARLEPRCVRVRRQTRVAALLAHCNVMEAAFHPLVTTFY